MWQLEGQEASFKKVKYVRHGRPTMKNRKERQSWGKSVTSFMNQQPRALIKSLLKDKMLHNWSGKLCPVCGAGRLGKLQFCKTKQTWMHRCSRKSCHRRIQPHDFHPIFSCSRNSTSLGTQAAILYCAVVGVPQAHAHLLLDVDDKVVHSVYNNLDIARARFVVEQEKHTKLGGSWEDVEADEVDIGKGLIPDVPSGGKNTQWEQWGGLLERGRSESLVMVRLNPKNTKARAPGPGPIRKRDWVPVANKFLKNRNWVLHTDGARAYKVKIPGVIHCNVVHMKKRTKVNGRAAGA